jgi:hypothetical protein
MSHTPGPWHYDPNDDVIWTDCDGDERPAFRKNLASELTSDDRYPKEEQLANVHLIAAVPEMLDALIEILHEVDGGFIGSPHWHVRELWQGNRRRIPMKTQTSGISRFLFPKRNLAVIILVVF